MVIHWVWERARGPLFHPTVAWGLLCAYAAVIFFLSSQPIGGEVSFVPHLDKLLHFLEYALFGALAYHAVRVSRSADHTLRNLLIAIGLGIAYGISDEFHQYFVPTREVSFADVVADALDAVAGAWLLARYEWNMRHAKQAG